MLLGQSVQQVSCELHESNFCLFHTLNYTFKIYLPFCSCNQVISLRRGPAIKT